MALTFPNRSRSYDAAGRRIRFVGYDGMFEVAFFVETGAIAKAVLNETGYLEAFDAARTRHPGRRPRGLCQQPQEHVRAEDGRFSLGAGRPEENDLIDPSDCHIGGPSTLRCRVSRRKSQALPRRLQIAACRGRAATLRLLFQLIAPRSLCAKSSHSASFL